MDWFWVTQSKTKGKFHTLPFVGDLMNLHTNHRWISELDIGIHSIKIGKKSYKNHRFEINNNEFLWKSFNHHHHHHILFKKKMTTCGEYVLLNHIKHDSIIMTTKLRLYKQYMIFFLKYVIGYVNTIFWLATSCLACNCIELSLNT
jgi:hypothetical protein